MRAAWHGRVADLRDGNERQQDLRQRRYAAGWVEVVIWVPRHRRKEARSVIENLVGKPPQAERPPSRVTKPKSKPEPG